jgi:hypothetical protein
MFISLSYGLPPTAGLLLITSAFFKAHQLSYHGVTLEGFLPSAPAWLHPSVIVVEFLLGLWMVTGLYLKVTRILGAVCFLLLGQIALWQALHGRESCGCLGIIKISPWVAVALDAVMFAGLAVMSCFGPAAPYLSATGRRTRLCFFVFIATAVAIPGILFMTTYKRDVKRFSDLRLNLALSKQVTVGADQQRAADLMRFVEKETGLALSMPPQLAGYYADVAIDSSNYAHRPVRAWTILETIARASSPPARWVETRNGYMLIVDDPISRTKYIWLISFILGCTCCLSSYLYIRRAGATTQARSLAASNAPGPDRATT